MQTQLGNVETPARVQNIFVYGNLFVKLDTRKVEVKGERVHLTDKEFALLKFFLLNCGVVSTKRQIMDALYVGEKKPEIKIIDVFVCKLRRKLAEALDSKVIIDTILGKGYILPKLQEPTASA